jgi:hypothetical protein
MDSVPVETIACALDTMRVEADLLQLAGSSVGDALAYGVRIAAIERIRKELIPTITVGTPSRPILADDVESATRGLGLRSAATDKDLATTLALHAGRLAFASQVIVAAIQAEQGRRA